VSVLPSAAPVAVGRLPHSVPEHYYRILRTPDYRRWRSFVGIMAALFGVVAVLPLVASPLLIVPALVQGFDPLHYVAQLAEMVTITPVVLAYINVTLGLLIPLCWLLIRFFHYMRPRWLASVRPGMRWGLLARCAGFAVALSLLQLVAMAFVLPPIEGSVSDAPPVGERLIALAIVALTTPFQSAGEEYLFRGYLSQAIGALTRTPLVPIFVTSVLFAAAHGAQDLPLFCDRLAFGLIAGWLVWRTGGLEAAIAMHAVNNLLALGIAIAVGALSSTLVVTGTSWWVAIVDIAMLLAFAAVVSWWCRRTGVRTRTEASGVPGVAG
jgi:hypothetical protein